MNKVTYNKKKSVVLDVLRREKPLAPAGIPTPHHANRSPVSTPTKQSKLLVTEEVFKDCETKESWLNTAR
jgi:hypothetical protein